VLLFSFARARHVGAMRRLRKYLVGFCCIGILLRGDGRAADPVDYRVVFRPSGDAALDSLLLRSASLVALRGKIPASPFGLIGRARADEGQFAIVLHSLGYDAGRVDVTIGGRALDDAGLLDVLDAAPGGQDVVVTVTPHRGALFHVGVVEFAGLPGDVRMPAAPRAGDVALAAPILAAGPAVVSALHDAGFAFAVVAAPVAVADSDGHTLNVTYSVDPGPRVAIGRVEFAGLRRADADWLRRHIGLRVGQRFSDKAVFSARDSLLGTGVFSAVTPEPVDVVKGGRIPVLFRVTEQKLHAVTVGGAYATDLGVTVSASWEDRDVFGHAETLTFTAAGNGLGGTGTTAPGYDVKGVFVKPDSWSVGQSGMVSLEGLKESVTAYDRTALLAQGSLSRPVTGKLTVSYGLGFVEERIYQEGVSRAYTLAQVPLTLSYDSANNALEPSEGVNASVMATPTAPVAGGGGYFVILHAYAATYLALERDAFGVLALRGQVGSVVGASQFQVPADQRFYAGGTSTVRGYTYQTVGPLFADDLPEGGLALDAASVELRQHVTRDIGVVPFVDAGQVSANNTPFEGHLSVGAGLGLRYYTGIGPIRLDFAVPLKRIAGSGAFAAYIGLGEAF